MAEERDYYEILGVERNASLDQIKRAFRRLARRYHPDVNPDDPGAEARFREIAEAYSVLGDPDRRAEYDRYGRRGRAGMPPGDIWDELGGFGSLFDMFFGQRAPSRPREVRGADLRYDLEIDLADVALGARKRIEVERLRGCAACGGTGSRSRSGQRGCPTCRGSGQVRRSTATPFGRLSTVATCSQCAGTGVSVADPCRDCGGAGRRPTGEEVTVTIPAGIEEGTTLRLDGEGEAGERGSPAGDLYVVVHVRPHEIFQRRGRDLYCEMPVSFPTAALGGTIEVPTLTEGPTQLSIPPGAQTGETFQLTGRGLPDPRTGVRGSQYVTVRVVTPTKLTPRQQELLAEFAREGGDQVDLPKGWFARLRDALTGDQTQ